MTDDWIRFGDFFPEDLDPDTLVSAFHVADGGPQHSLLARPIGGGEDQDPLGYAVLLRDGSVVFVTTRPDAKLGVSDDADQR